MGNEEHGQVTLFLQFHQQVDDLRLNGYVQCRDRFVAEEEFRVNGQCSRDTDTLTLAAGELVNVTHCMLGVQTYHIQQFQNQTFFLFFVFCQTMNADTFRNDVIYFLMWVQRCVWVLEDHLHLFGEVKAFLLGQLVDIFALVLHFAAGLWQHTDAGFAAGGFTTAGLTNDTQCFTFMDHEGNVIHCFQHAVFAGAVIFAEIADFQFYRSVIHAAHLRSGMEYR